MLHASGNRWLAGHRTHPFHLGDSALDGLIVAPERNKQPHLSNGEMVDSKAMVWGFS